MEGPKFISSGYSRLEKLVMEMQHHEFGVHFKPQNSFLTTIPATVSGRELIDWISKRLDAESPFEANHLANMLLNYGYIYSVSGTQTTVVNDGLIIYRFQAPCYWKSKIPDASDMDYAIYLVKRNLRGRQQFVLSENEKAVLDKLNKLMCNNWEFICLHAEEEVRIAKHRKKGDRTVLDRQEQAFWQLHRPPDDRPSLADDAIPRTFTAAQTADAKAKRARKTSHDTIHSTISGLNTLANRQHRPPVPVMLKATTLTSKSIDNLLSFNCHHAAYDWFYDHRAETINVWCLPAQSQQQASDSTCNLRGEAANQVAQFLEGTSSEYYSVKQLRLWATGFDFLIRDKAGLKEFEAFLQKEFSAENLRFYLAVEDFKFGAIGQLSEKALNIFDTYLKHGAVCEINIDSKTMLTTENELKAAINRFAFEEAQIHIYALMKNDSYVRYLRSDDYAAALKAATERQQASLQQLRSISAGNPVTPFAQPAASKKKEVAMDEKTTNSYSGSD